MLKVKLYLVYFLVLTFSAYANGLDTFYYGYDSSYDDTQEIPSMGVFKAQAISIPSSLNWCNKGYCNPIQSQGSCGSCWSFAAVAAIEGQYFKATGKLLKFSGIFFFF